MAQQSYALHMRHLDEENEDDDNVSNAVEQIKSRVDSEASEQTHNAYTATFSANPPYDPPRNSLPPTFSFASNPSHTFGVTREVGEDPPLHLQ